LLPGICGSVSLIVGTRRIKAQSPIRASTAPQISGLGRIGIRPQCAGDPAAAKLRIDAIRGLGLLDTNEDIEALADFLLLGGGLPLKARFDALHIAFAAYHRVNVVPTWNFKHIANPVQLPVMRGLCDARGYRLPELVSPLEMMEN